MKRAASVSGKNGSVSVVEAICHRLLELEQRWRTAGIVARLRLHPPAQYRDNDPLRRVKHKCRAWVPLLTAPASRRAQTLRPSASTQSTARLTVPACTRRSTIFTTMPIPPAVPDAPPRNPPEALRRQKDRGSSAPASRSPTQALRQR